MIKSQANIATRHDILVYFFQANVVGNVAHIFANGKLYHLPDSRPDTGSGDRRPRQATALTQPFDSGLDGSSTATAEPRHLESSTARAQPPTPARRADDAPWMPARE